MNSLALVPLLVWKYQLNLWKHNVHHSYKSYFLINVIFPTILVRTDIWHLLWLWIIYCIWTCSRGNPPCGHVPPCIINYSCQEIMPCRIIAPASMIEKATEELRPYWAAVSPAVQDLLGPHPFWRVDIVVFPDCSQDMAMAKLVAELVSYIYIYIYIYNRNIDVS